MSYIDFYGINVTNLTPSWLIPGPYPFTQWFPFQSFEPASGVLQTVTDQYTGLTYVPDGQYMLYPPSYANWTDVSPNVLTLTVYTPSKTRAVKSGLTAPAVYHFQAQKK